MEADKSELNSDSDLFNNKKKVGANRKAKWPLNLVYLRRVDACLYLRWLFKGKKRMSPYFFHGLLPMILCSVAEHPTASHSLSGRLSSKVLSTHVFSTISFPRSPLHARMFNNLKCHHEVGLAFSLLRLSTDFMTPSLPHRMWSRKIKRRLSFW